MNKLLAFLIGILLLTACSEEDPSPIISSTDYFPNTKGSSWHYKGSLSTSLVVTGEAIKLDGKDYFKIESSNSSVSTYVAKKNGEYYLRGFVQGVSDQNLLVLKESVRVGAIWSQQLLINKVENLFTYTLVRKDASMINGINYDDVVTVKMEQSFTYQNQALPVCEVVFHFARGVGLVKLETDYHNLTGLQSLNGISELENYTVN
jgi:hypothetical protein